MQMSSTAGDPFQVMQQSDRSLILITKQYTSCVSQSNVLGTRLDNVHDFKYAFYFVEDGIDGELQLFTMWLIAISDEKLESCQRVTQTAFGPPFKHAVNKLQLNGEIKVLLSEELPFQRSSVSA